jgi:hypothetical protein
MKYITIERLQQLEDIIGFVSSLTEPVRVTRSNETDEIPEASKLAQRLAEINIERNSLIEKLINFK